jgi:hypothetical protein
MELLEKGRRMTKKPIALATLCVIAGVSAAEPDYAVIRMEIDIARPAAEVWSKVGGYCDIAKWRSDLDCKMTKGEGEIGSIRALAGGRIVDIMIAKTALSYGYTQPAVEGKFFNMYHGFMEAVPVNARSSKIVYTLFIDESDKPDHAAKDADIARRRTTFEAALKTMKEISEAK